jgi:hypothetical protein
MGPGRRARLGACEAYSAGQRGDPDSDGDCGGAGDALELVAIISLRLYSGGSEDPDCPHAKEPTCARAISWTRATAGVADETHVTVVTDVTTRVVVNLRRHARHAVTCENF